METEAKADVKFVWLTDSDVLRLWDMLFQFIMASGLYQPVQVSMMLTHTMSGANRLWMMYTKEDSTIEPYAVLITRQYHLPYTGERVCSLIHGNSIQDDTISVELWQTAYKALIKYARSEKCDRFEVYSNNDRVRDILLAFGFKESGLYRKEL